jgi:hypothetical protein
VKGEEITRCSSRALKRDIEGMTAASSWRSWTRGSVNCSRLIGVLASGYAERSDDGQAGVRIGQQPGMEDWSSTSLRGEVTALSPIASSKAIGHDIDAIVQSNDRRGRRFSSLAAVR